MEDTGFSMVLDEYGFPVILEPNKKRESWFRGDTLEIPDNYRLQLGLYLYLRNIDRGLFAVGFLRAEDYKLPHLFEPDDREIVYEWMFMNPKAFEPFVNYARNWYMKYVKTGIAPKMTPDDQKWLDMQMKESTWGKDVG
jgi:hypothetical protein